MTHERSREMGRAEQQVKLVNASCVHCAWSPGFWCESWLNEPYPTGDKVLCHTPHCLGEVLQGFDVPISRAGDTEHSTRLHSFASSAYGSLPWLCSLLLLQQLKCHRSGTRLTILELLWGLGKMIPLCCNPGFLKIHHGKPCYPECFPVVRQRTMKPDKLRGEMRPRRIDTFPRLKVREAPVII